ncbi:unnamed protein product [Allacma fusca]|uniref:Uncharacterized protein n=1 Tax=Allacma fusca TaxID=39272 RepID=A0A8J2PE41_9HEXA|nr:unnamed protein product [Allacma fusca]
MQPEYSTDLMSTIWPFPIFPTFANILILKSRHITRGNRHSLGKRKVVVKNPPKKWPERFNNLYDFQLHH